MVWRFTYTILLCVWIPREDEGGLVRARAPTCRGVLWPLTPSPWASCLPRGLSVGLRGRLLRELTVPPPPRPLPRAQSPGRTPLTAADDLVNRCECVQQMSDGALPKCGRAHLLRHLPTCSPTSRTHSSLLAPAPSFILTPATALALQSSLWLCFPWMPTKNHHLVLVTFSTRIPALCLPLHQSTHKSEYSYVQSDANYSFLNIVI